MNAVEKDIFPKLKTLRFIAVKAVKTTDTSIIFEENISKGSTIFQGFVASKNFRQDMEAFSRKCQCEKLRAFSSKYPSGVS